MEDQDAIPTSAVTFIETEHGRTRRKQRGIDKKDLKLAKKMGVKEKYWRQKNGDKAAKYTYKDIVYIVNERTGAEITSYARPIQLKKVPVSAEMLHNHEKACQRIRQDPDSWSSHFILVVDTSGSMKEADIWGAPSRLSAVWLSLALDFLAHRLESGSACSTDVISIVALGEPSKILMVEKPSTWVLYNQLVRLYQSQSIKPQGHGPYLPALRKAESMLIRSVNKPCAAGLVFLSDGRPSDATTNSNGLSYEECAEKVCLRIANLSKRFGRRLTFQAVGIGDMDDFDILQRMVDAAKDFGAQAELQVPSMTSSDLGGVFTTVATSMTTTQAEMTELGTTQQRPVRKVIQESRTEANKQLEAVAAVDFHIYGVDQVKRSVYREWMEDQRRRKAFVDAPLQHPEACYVALGKCAFGEGAERFAYRFFELAADKMTILGKALVAKENRLVVDSNLGDEEARKKFVRTFCSTQQLARRLAQEFNIKLSETRRADPRTPTVSFLDCSVYQLNDKNLGKLSVLVEEKLDHTKWHKWNANNGYIEGMKSAPEISQERIREAVQQLSTFEMEVIEETSEKEESSSVSTCDSETKLPESQVLFTPSEVAQAFSHFTYRASGRKRLVCDLQGVYDAEVNELKFSDPVIHYYNPYRCDRRHVHGRTDRGGKGVAMFFETHRENHCGYLCRLMLRGFRKLNANQQQKGS